MNDRHLTPEPKKTDSSSRSSTSGEDGFVSGGSLPEENLDRLNYQFSSLGLKEPQKNGKTLIKFGSDQSARNASGTTDANDRDIWPRR